MTLSFYGPLIIHIPHASTLIPADTRDQIVLAPAELERELLLMTDRYTDELFDLKGDHIQRLVYPVSRLTVDPERFRDDIAEQMAKRGMGAVYIKTAYGAPLRKPIEPQEREHLLRSYYDPHHVALSRLVAGALAHHGRCVIVDAHSFPSKPLPCDLNQEPNRPDICLGTNSYHTPKELIDAAKLEFEREGWSVGVDWPYNGAIVPIEFYQHDPRVTSIMIEINRRMYMDEQSGEKLAGFEGFAARIGKIVNEICAKAQVSPAHLDEVEM